MTSAGKQDAVGASPARPDGAGKVNGDARYVDDLVVEGMWHGATVRSPHAAARIVSIDPGQQPTDAFVLTAADLGVPNGVQLITDDWPILAAERVQHVGEPVALVCAPTRALAREAARRVRVTYEELPAVLTLDQALAGDPRTGGELNVLAKCGLERGDPDGVLGAAGRVIEEVYETGLQEHVYIEPQGMLARLDGDRIEVTGSMQCPFYVHRALERLFGEGSVRVRQAVTGGGFGGKEDYPSMLAAHAALLARGSGHAVKMVYDRHEDIIGTTKRHPSRVRVQAAVTDAGELQALDVDLLLDGGAYTTLSPVVLSRAVLHATGPYRCLNVRIRGRALATNTATNGAFRGFGAPQAQFAIERHMDRIAREVGLDPLTLRERNAYRPGDVTATGQVLDESVSALECLRLADERTRFRERWRAQEERRRTGQEGTSRWSGIGLALCWHGAGFTGNGERKMRSPAEVRLGADGAVEVLVASTDFGQGTTIALAQIVADAVGVPCESVRVVDPDTDVVPDSGPTVASRTIMIVGDVLERAGRGLARALCRFVAEQGSLDPDDVHLRDGTFAGPGGASQGGFGDVVRSYLARHGALSVVERHEPDESTFDEETYQGTAYAAYGWGADVVEVTVDSDTLSVHTERAFLACDVGKAIHPVLCAGQVEGGSLQAFGFATMEEIKTEGGRYLNDTLATYVIPTTLDAPDMETVLIENAAAVGPRGAKGVGEIPMDGGAPAVLAAIENATGIVPRRAPATPEVLLEDLLAGRTVEGAPRVTETLP